MTVLDASALVAWLNNEAGSAVVSSSWGQGTFITAVNWAEVLSVMNRDGVPPHEIEHELDSRGILHQSLQVLDFTAADARRVAELHGMTRTQGLSLGDCACLALAERLNAAALTADRTWATLNLGITVQLIRP